jgi:hypothetical protein
MTPKAELKSPCMYYTLDNLFSLNYEAMTSLYSKFLLNNPCCQHALFFNPFVKRYQIVTDLWTSHDKSMPVLSSDSAKLNTFVHNSNKKRDDIIRLNCSSTSKSHPINTETGNKYIHQFESF